MATTHILAVGRIEHGEIEMDIAMLPWVDENEPVDGELQRLIDEALNEPLTRDQRADEAVAQFEFERYYRWCQAEDQDLRDGIDEADWIRGGC